MASQERRLLSSAFLRALSFPSARPVCPTCALSRLVPPAKAPRTPRRPDPSARLAIQTRRASTHASATAINATKEISPRLKALHDSLGVLKKDAANYVNVSRVQLALRSLESAWPVTRIAILGLRHTSAAKKLVRVLLADVLSDQGDWERHLERLEAEDQRGLLIRYGEDTGGLVPDSLVATLYVPSRFLEQHNLEILVSSLNTSAGLTDRPTHAAEIRRTALVPTAEAPRTFSGSVEFIRYPVHRAIVLTEGIRGCMILGQYAAYRPTTESEQVSPLRLAVDLAGIDAGAMGTDPHEVEGVSTLDLSSGAQAVQQFRASNQNAVAYEQGWHRSGLTQLRDWIAKGADATPAAATTDLVRDILSETSHRVALELASERVRLSDLAASQAARRPLDEALGVWAAAAHAELRAHLDLAFADRRWAKLAWWKLLWRVDDVTMILSELLARSWLVDAEKRLIWLSGRGVEAGVDFGASETRDATHATVPAVDHPDEPWPTTIPAARRGLQASTVPSLQALAQALLLQTISISSLTAALSTLVYVALPTATAYSAGAVAALGAVWSLRHLQRRWEAARAAWEADVREAGRIVLREAETGFRRRLVLGPRGVDDVVVRERARAVSAVEGVAACLEEVLRQS